MTMGGMEGSPVRCSCCQRSALRVVGNTVQVHQKHDGAHHITVIPIRDLMRLAGLLDSRGVIVHN